MPNSRNWKWKKNFNERVLRLRSEKSKVINKLEDIYKETIIIQDNLDPTDRIAIPPIPILDSEEHEVDLFSIEVKDVEKNVSENSKHRFHINWVR